LKKLIGEIAYIQVLSSHVSFERYIEPYEGTTMETLITRREEESGDSSRTKFKVSCCELEYQFEPLKTRNDSPIALHQLYADLEEYKRLLIPSK
jgi:hypothetical protein